MIAMEPEKNEIFIDNSYYDCEAMDHETRLHILETQMLQCMTNFRTIGHLLKAQEIAIIQLQSDIDSLKSDISPQTDERFK